MEFSEAYELNDLLKITSGSTRNRENQNALSTLEKMMNYGLDIDDKRGNSPLDPLPQGFTHQTEYLTEPVEPIKLEEKPTELGPVVLQVTRDDNYRETYQQSLCKVSNLTESLKTNTNSKPPPGVPITVFLFGTQEKLKVIFPKKATIEQVIPRIIYAYINDEKFKHKTLPFGPVVEAYEIWYLDSNNLPESEVENTLRVKDLLVISLGFVVKPEYSDEEKTLPINEVSGTGKVVKVYYEKKCNAVEMALDSSVLGILDKLSAFYGYLNPEEFEFKVVVHVEEFSEQECDINMDLKIESLDTNELKLYRKVYADMPSPTKNIKSAAPLKEPESEAIYDASRYNMTVAQASAYKEYEVIKTNRKGKRQKRILGINQLRLHNMTVAQAKQKLKEKALGNRDNVFRKKIKSMFESVTQHAAIEISSILCIKQDTKNYCCFYIDYVESGKKKKKLYETEKSMITVEIISKINKLMQLVKNN